MDHRPVMIGRRVAPQAVDVPARQLVWAEAGYSFFVEGPHESQLSSSRMCWGLWIVSSLEACVSLVPDVATAIAAMPSARVVINLSSPSGKSIPPAPRSARGRHIRRAAGHG